VNDSRLKTAARTGGRIMAVDWGEMADSMFQGATWQESLGIWKLSNVLGWYMSNYGALKTQLMIGFERKINMAWKYEYYMAAPTKTLLYGENKIDMAKSKKATPYWESLGLIFSASFQSRSVKYFADDIKKADETKWIAAVSTMTVGKQNVTVTIGDSTETINVGAKVIEATVGDVRIAGSLGVTLMQSEGSWLEVTADGCTVTAPIINLG
jgi:hypothetical protein